MIKLWKNMLQHIIISSKKQIYNYFFFLLRLLIIIIALIAINDYVFFALLKAYSNILDE